MAHGIWLLSEEVRRIAENLDDAATDPTIYPVDAR
jgi:hypothetical protein